MPTTHVDYIHVDYIHVDYIHVDYIHVDYIHVDYIHVGVHECRGSSPHVASLPVPVDSDCVGYKSVLSKTERTSSLILHNSTLRLSP